MLSHKQIWAALDALAEKNNLSASGLARKAGLDATSFNPSKRVSPDGRKRWPSTESIAQVLTATGATFDDFAGLIAKGARARTPRRAVPLLGFAEAGAAGYFDDAGFPAGRGWEQVKFPGVDDENAYALEVSGRSMEPLYRHGDRVIVSPAAELRKGDRVVVKTHDGEVMIKVLARRSARKVELTSINPEFKPRQLDVKDIAWMARIVWASQ